MRHFSRAVVIALSMSVSALVPFAASAQDDEVVITAAMAQEFDSWKWSFRSEALNAGISPSVYDAAFAGVTLNPKVLRLDRKQPEFSRPIWKYLESAVSETRIDNGRTKRAQLMSLMARIEQAYQVDAQIVLGIWGLESAYGAFYGNNSVIRSLATLAFEGRRAKFAKEQLLAALRILQNGDIMPEQMRGSWAGAIGHTQFIPTSFEEYAVDFTGDGRRDFWGDDPADALASAANYLKRHGWRYREPAYAIVRVPPSIDWYELNRTNKRDVREWASRGVTRADGGPLPNLGEAAIELPAGARGPAIMTFHNFGVIKRYNNATSYALGVAHLGERIMGGGPLNVRWPEDDRPLGRTEKKTLQQSLTDLGFDTQGVDGILGPNSAKAIRDFQRTRGLPADGYASEKLLARVEMATSGSEPLAPNQIAWVQGRLTQLGYNAGVPDGVAGPQTRAAIIAFQRAYGFVPTGEADMTLIKQLGG